MVLFLWMTFVLVSA